MNLLDVIARTVGLSGWGIVVFAVLCGCTPQPQPPVTPMSASAYTPGAPMQVGECPYAVNFPGPPESQSEKPKTYDVDRYLDYRFVDNAAQLMFMSSCGCSNTVKYADVTRYQAFQALETNTKASDFTLLDKSFRDAGPEGKFVYFTAESPSPWGKIRLQGRGSYFGNCIFLVGAGGAVARYDERRINSFLDSARPIVAPSNVPKTTPGPSSTAGRLQELKELYDQHLITPQEYETRRKAILDAL